MAIQIQTLSESTVPMNYHRIVSVHCLTNIENTIEICSYPSKEAREEEKEALEKNETVKVYMENTFIPVPYDQNMNVIDAYNYIKELPQYAGALDI